MGLNHTHLSFSSSKILNNNQLPNVALMNWEHNCIKSSPWPTSTVQAGGSWGLSTGPVDLLPPQKGLHDITCPEALVFSFCRTENVGNDGPRLQDWTGGKVMSQYSMWN